MEHPPHTATADHSDDRQGEQPGSGRLVAALMVAVTGFAIQQTAAVPALHQVQQAFGASKEWTSWLVTVYLIVAVAATPAMGRLADLYGRRRMLLIGLVVFAVASAAAAAAPSMAFLLVCRAVQGVGGAVYPLALALGRENVPAERTSGVVAALTSSFGIGTAVGFLGGGALVQFVSWRAIFVAGAVAVAVGVALAVRWVPSEGSTEQGHYDVVGTLVLALASISLLAGLTLAVSLGWLSPVPLGLLVLALLGAALWVRHERRSDEPLLDLEIFRTRQVSVANLATIGLGWALFGSYLLIPDLVQADPARSGYGLAAGSLLTGVLLSPLAVGQTLLSGLGPRLQQRLPSRLLFGAGLAAVAGASVLLALTRTNPWALGVATFLLGAGAGTALQASSSVTTSAVDAEVAAASTATNSTVRRLAGGVGGQVNTAVLAAFTATGAATAAFTGYVICYGVAAALCVAGIGVLAL